MMTETQTVSSRIEADVRALLNQGDISAYRQSLATKRGVSLDVVDAAIAAVGGTPRVVDAETLAQERLSEDRRMSRQQPTAWRANNHEEEYQ